MASLVGTRRLSSSNPLKTTQNERGRVAYTLPISHGLQVDAQFDSQVSTLLL